jgi:hypothetical protein
VKRDPAAKGARQLGLGFAGLVVGTAVFVALDQAQAQQAPTASQSGANGAVDNNGQDFTRPQNLFQLRYEYRTAPGSGSEPGTIRTVTTDSVILRSDLKFDIAPQWTLALRGDLPFVDRNPITAGNPLGEFIDGLGDADVQAALIKTLNSRWAAGAGVRIIAPTGSADLTSGRWQALPIVGARYMLLELGADSYFTGLVRYDVSFAGDPSKRNISNLQLAPTLNIDLPKRWFVTFYPNPDIQLNFGDPITGQTGRLFLPFDFMVGRTVMKDVTVSLEIGVPMIRDYPVYDFKTVARLNVKF